MAREAALERYIDERRSFVLDHFSRLLDAQSDQEAVGRISRRTMKGAQEMTSAIAALRCQRFEIKLFRAIVLHAFYNSAKTVMRKPMPAFLR